MGVAAALRSSAVSRYEISAVCVAASGRGMPTGGIAPACSFLITFSQMAAESPARARSVLSRMTPETVADVVAREL